MKHLFNKLSAFIIMLMCMSATVQAEIVHHEVCEPTISSRGFTRECWENTATGKIFSDANCTQEIVDDALAKAVVYARLYKSPISDLDDFTTRDTESTNYVTFNWCAERKYTERTTSYDDHYSSAYFTVTGNNARNVRLKWAVTSFSELVNNYEVCIYLNGKEVSRNNNPGKGVFVYNLNDAKEGDVIRFYIYCSKIISSRDYTEYFYSSLEYTFDCQHEYPDGSAICSLCGNIKEHEHVYSLGCRGCSMCGYERDFEFAHHAVCNPSLNSPGFKQECWENLDTHQFYTDEALTQELVNEALAKAVVYAKLPSSPITATSEFTQSEHENDWSVDFNWAAVTTFQNAKTNTYTTPRYAEFTATGEDVSNARLVWNRSHGSIVNGKYTVKIYVNGTEKFSVDQNDDKNVEGVFVQPLLGLKQGDVVKFEVTPNAKAT